MASPNTLIDMFVECKKMAAALREMDATEPAVQRAKQALIRLSRIVDDEMIGPPIEEE